MLRHEVALAQYVVVLAQIKKRNTNKFFLHAGAEVPILGRSDFESSAARNRTGGAYGSLLHEAGQGPVAA
jgi:hypothetical protein